MAQTKKPHGFSIRIFLPDGTPDGLKLVEKSNWSGRKMRMEKPWSCLVCAICPPL